MDSTIRTNSPMITNDRHQMATQFPNAVAAANSPAQAQAQAPQQQATFLSILKEGKMQLQEINMASKPDSPIECLLKSLIICTNQFLAYADQYPNNFTQFLPENMKLPMITIDMYIARILKYSPCSKECFITTLMYIDRLITKRGFVVNSYNIHRILITGILVAAKYLDDIFYNNHFYSQVGGVSVKEINSLELDLLKLLSFDVGTDFQTYIEYSSAMEMYSQRIQQHLCVPVASSLPVAFPDVNLLDSIVFLKDSPSKDKRHPSRPSPNTQHQSTSSSSSSSSYTHPNCQTASSCSSSSSNHNNNHITTNSTIGNNVNNYINTKSNCDDSSNKPAYLHQSIPSFRYQPQPDCVA
ncbi:hypothetical protein SAMD00019534_116640, partial [Acytostelium subglobosum LB1]|uniref:hypothetical protein n=1 Tax=Acytostelium subglobosum LB1 TaxID=1410327 RepID=UPI000644DEF8